MQADRAKSPFRDTVRAFGAAVVLVLAASCQQTPDDELAVADGAGSGNAAAAAPAAGDVNLERDYVLGQNDKVELRVFGQEELSGEYRIGSGGTLSMPLLGEVQAGGKTADQLATDIEQQLAAGYLRDPQVTVEVTEYRPIFVLGGVRSPGSYNYTPGMTVLQAIAMAGGYSDAAEEDEGVTVTRGSAGGQGRVRGGPMTRVFPGDSIEVPQRVRHEFGPG